MISALVEARPVGRVDRQAELVVGPAGQRPAAPVGLEELAGRRQVDLLDRRRRPSRARNSSRSVAAELELVAVVTGRTS